MKLALICTLFFFISIGLSAQDSELPDNFSEPLPLYSKALGSFERPISSRNEEAQAYFNQGFQMMYAFAKMDAVRSFRESWKRDENCAICYWGEAWAWGSYLNGPMTASDAPRVSAPTAASAPNKRSSPWKSATASRW